MNWLVSMPFGRQVDNCSSIFVYENHLNQLCLNNGIIHVSIDVMGKLGFMGRTLESP